MKNKKKPVKKRFKPKNQKKRKITRVKSKAKKTVNNGLYDTTKNIFKRMGQIQKKIERLR